MSDTTTHLPWAYLCQSLDGDFVYITADALDATMESFRMQIGDGAHMHAVPIKHVLRSPKSGAYSMSTLDGVYVRLPATTRFVRRGSFRWLSKLVYRLSGDNPTMGGEMLYRLNPDDYTISQQADGIVGIS